MRTKISVFCASRFYLGSLIKIISAEDDMEVFYSGTRFELKQKYWAEILIIEKKLIEPNNHKIIQEIASTSECKIIVIPPSKFQNSELIEDNVDGYLLKEDSHSEIVYGIRQVLQGKLFISNNLQSN